MGARSPRGSFRPASLLRLADPEAPARQEALLLRALLDPAGQEVCRPLLYHRSWQTVCISGLVAQRALAHTPEFSIKLQTCGACPNERVIPEGNLTH